MKYSKYLVIVLVIILLLSLGAGSIIGAQAEASLYFVDQNHSGASDSNDGSEGSPWLTIAHAAQVANAGDIVYIKDGIYNEIVVVENSGSAGNPITFMAYPGHDPILDGTGFGGWYGLFSIYGKDFIRLEGLEIRNNDTGWGVLIEHDGGDPAANIELVNLEVHHTGGEAVQVRGNAYDILIQGCEVHDGDTYSGIDIYQWNGGRPHNVTVTGCTAYNYPGFAGIASEQADYLLIENNTTYDSDLGIDIGSGDANVIRDNTIYSCNSGLALSSNEDSLVYGNTIYDIYDEAIYAYYWSSHGEDHARNKWYNNTIYKAGFGIYESNQKGSNGGEGPTSNHEYYNNLFFNVGTHGSYRAPFHFEGTTELKFYNNTIYMNADHDALELLDGAVNADIRNNIISVSGSGIPINVDASSTGAVIDYNCYHNRSGSLTGPGDHSITGDPLFVSVGSDDFHLQSDSPCIDAGVNLSAHHTTDLDGVSRPQGAGWDIGAYEFVPDLILYGTPGDQTIYLDWTLNTTLPPTSTWRIDYYTTTLNILSAFDPLSATRSYTLTELTNYEWYTITLTTEPLMLADSLRIMPTDKLVYLPLILRSFAGEENLLSTPEIR